MALDPTDLLVILPDLEAFVSVLIVVGPDQPLHMNALEANEENETKQLFFEIQELLVSFQLHGPTDGIITTFPPQGVTDMEAIWVFGLPPQFTENHYIGLFLECLQALGPFGTVYLICNTNPGYLPLDQIYDAAQLCSFTVEEPTFEITPGIFFIKLDVVLFPN